VSFDALLSSTLTVRRVGPVTSGGAEKAGGADTTLTADTAAGATAVHVASAAGIAAGDWLRIGDAGEAEARQVAVGGVAGLVVTVTMGLSGAHDAGDHVRELDDAGAVVVDDQGTPVYADTTVATVRGLIQPRSAREVALASQAGVVIGEHVGYIRPLAGLTTADWLEDDQYPGARFDLVSMPDAAGQGHHLELGLRRIG
jgi:hypothetical protein